MTLRYSIFYYLTCTHIDPESGEGCVTETESVLNPEKMMEDAKGAGWVTEDGLHWFCPEHHADAVPHRYIPKHLKDAKEPVEGVLDES